MGSELYLKLSQMAETCFDLNRKWCTFTVEDTIWLVNNCCFIATWNLQAIILLVDKGFRQLTLTYQLLNPIDNEKGYRNDLE